MFQIDKKFVIDAYKGFLDKKGIGKNYDTDLDLNRKKDHSVYDVLTKVLDMYKLIRKFALVQARREFIHDDKAFDGVKGILHTCIRNKIRTSAQGSLYINVNSNISFSGEVDEYEKWIVNDKNKTYSLIRNIVDEYNSCLRGEEIKDDNKPLLNDEKREAIYVMNNISKEHIELCMNGDFEKFNESFQRVMINVGVEKNEWVRIMQDMRSILAFSCP